MATESMCFASATSTCGRKKNGQQAHFIEENTCFIYLCICLVIVSIQCDLIEQMYIQRKFIEIISINDRFLGLLA